MNTYLTVMDVKQVHVTGPTPIMGHAGCFSTKIALNDGDASYVEVTLHHGEGLTWNAVRPEYTKEPSE